MIRVSSLLSAGDIPGPRFYKPCVAFLQRIAEVDLMVESASDHDSAIALFSTADFCHDFDDLRDILADEVIRELYKPSGAHALTRIFKKMNGWLRALRQSELYYAATALRQLYKLMILELYIRDPKCLSFDLMDGKHRSAIQWLEKGRFIAVDYKRWAGVNIPRSTAVELERIRSVGGRKVQNRNSALIGTEWNAVTCYPSRFNDLGSMGIVSIEFLLPRSGCSISSINIRYTFPDLSTTNAGYVPEANELYEHGAVRPLRCIFERVGNTLEYELLRRATIRAIDRILTAHLVVVEEQSLSDEQLEVSTEQEVDSAPQPHTLNPLIETASGPSPRQGSTRGYLKNLTFREAIRAFERMEVEVSFSHHAMITYSGKTVRFCGRHQTNTRIVEKSARDVCRALEIPWADFVTALK